MIFAELIACRRPRKVERTARDHRLVPLRPVLFFQAQQIALAVQPRRETRCIQQHQRQQRMGLGLIASRMLRQQICKANRFLAEFFPNQILATRRFVAFVK